MTISALYHGLAVQYGSLQVLTQKVVEACPSIRRLYLLGQTLSCRRTESLFTEGAPSVRHIAHYYVLAVVERPQGRSCDALQDMIENNLLHWVPVTAFVVEEAQFASWRIGGHPFACAVAQKGLLLHGEREEAPFPATGSIQEEHEGERRPTVQASFARAGSFMAGAGHCTQRKEYALALFLLHQSTEQALRALLLLRTGLRVNTHNLDKLLRYNTMFSHRLPELLKRETPQEAERFALLQSAYIASRYRDDFKVSGSDAAALQKSVEALLQLLEESLSETTV